MPVKDHPVSEAIILAGGLGTRLRSVLPDLPKAMAPVAGKPLLGWIIRRLREQGISRIILSLGFRHDAITAYVAQEFPEDDILPSIEDEPLGTGGAVHRACTLGREGDVLILNGDTFFNLSLTRLWDCHQKNRADCTLGLKPMRDFSRYGVVETAPDGAVTGFREKQPVVAGLINGGVYLLDRKRFLTEDLPMKFSFEKDYLEAYLAKRRFYGLVDEGYFIDIGIPEDYDRAQLEIPVQFN